MKHAVLFEIGMAKCRIFLIAAGTLVFSLNAFCIKSSQAWDWNALFQQADETKAHSLLKAFQVSSEVYWMEREQFGSIKELYEETQKSGARDRSIEELYGACEDNPSAKPAGGYLFKMLDTDSSGKLSHPHQRVGICAYPADERSKGKVICAVCDIETSEKWGYYAASYADIGGPPSSWPDGEHYQKMKTYSAQEGVKKARELYDQAPKSNARIN